MSTKVYPTYASFYMREATSASIISETYKVKYARTSVRLLSEKEVRAYKAKLNIPAMNAV